MRLRDCVVSFTILAALQLGTPLFAADHEVSDVALTPGGDMSQLNIAWHHSDNDCGCVVEVAEKRGNAGDRVGYDNEFPEASSTFHGTNQFIGLDENSAVTYACEATVSDLDESTDYLYRLGNGEGEWSDIYEYATKEEEGYSFFYVADSQIGASGPNARSRDIMAFIAEYQTRKTYPEFSDDEVKVVVDALTGNAGTDDLLGMAGLEEETDLLYETFSKDTTDNLSDLRAMAPDLADGVLVLQMAAAEEDARGWNKTVEVMSENFPDAAFMLSGGDQVELKDREYEYTGFFSPDALTSLPVAPAIGSHEQAVNFGYHFNLPNESSQYGVNSAGGDYYFRYGDVLFMVLNMDATQSEFPQQAPPGEGGGQGGASPPGQGGGHQQGASSPPGQGMDMAAMGGRQGGASPPGQGGGGHQQGKGSSPPGQGTGMAAGGPPGGPSPPGMDEPIESDEAFQTALSELEHAVDEETGESYDKLEKFKNSVAGHEAFMEEAMAAHPDAVWKVVMWHYSIYSTGSHGTDDVIRAIRYFMVPVLDDLEIDVVLLAHDHCFTRTYQMLGDEPQPDQKVDEQGRVINPTGILYLTANSSSGSKYYGLNRSYDVTDNPDTPEIEGPDPYFDYVAVAEQLRKPLFSHITVDGSSFEISTYRADTMEMVDSYTIIKR